MFSDNLSQKGWFYTCGTGFESGSADGFLAVKKILFIH
jgi:hypothetical protein